MTKVVKERPKRDNDKRSLGVNANDSVFGDGDSVLDEDIEIVIIDDEEQKKASIVMDVIVEGIFIIGKIF